MKNLRGTYVHRGDAYRRRKRFKRTALALSFFGAAAFVVGNRNPAAPTAEAAPINSTGFKINVATDRSLTFALDSAKGELELVRAQLERAQKIIGYSSRYDIGADLAGTIVDVASAEGIDPELAFRLVKLESDFKVRATSPVGAIGLTQVMPATARYYVKGITAEKLYDPQTNLRIGFRYLRGLVNEYDGNVKLALLAYNRGPERVDSLVRQGINPDNGYPALVMRDWIEQRKNR